MTDESLQNDIAEIKQALRRIDSTLHGNGSPGLKTRVALLESWKSGASRLMWIAVGSAFAAVTSAGIVVFRLMIGGGK